MTGSVQFAELRRTSLSRKNEKLAFLWQNCFLQTLYSIFSKFELIIELIEHAYFQDY
jgi:hypothetical protein